MASLSDSTILVATLLAMGVGLLGSVLPGLPGVTLIFLAALIYGFLTDFETIGAVILILLGLFAAVAFVLDFIATSYGARRFGASNWGTASGTIGGVFLGEYLRRQRTPAANESTPETPGARGDWRRVSRAAGGVLIGLGVSMVSQGLLGLASVIAFVLAVIY